MVQEQFRFVRVAWPASPSEPAPEGRAMHPAKADDCRAITLKMWNPAAVAITSLTPPASRQIPLIAGLHRAETLRYPAKLAACYGIIIGGQFVEIRSAIQSAPCGSGILLIIGQNLADMHLFGNCGHVRNDFVTHPGRFNGAFNEMRKEASS